MTHTELFPQSVSYHQTGGDDVEMGLNITNAE